MGVRSLGNYMYGLPNGCEKIDILIEIEKFRFETGIAHPIILFDVMGFIHCFGGSNDEAILGGLHNVYIEIATNFFETLKSCGAKLVFVCDGQLQPNRIDVWCKRKDLAYKEAMSVLASIDAGRYWCSDKYNHRGSKYFVSSLLSTAKRYGTVVIATDNDCDAMLAQYATAHNALAIVANDSDFMIYEGDWQYWYVGALELLQFTTKRFNRDALLDHLRLSRYQMKVFATIAGNDYTNSLYASHRKRPQEIDRIANFCRTLSTANVDDAFYHKIVDYIAGGERMERDAAVRTVKTSIESYSIDFEQATDADNLELYVRENVLMAAILKHGIFQYDVSYIDFRSNNNGNEGFLAKIIDVLRRLSGILLHDKRTEETYFKLVTKHSFESKYELTHEEPVYPELEVPTLNDLIFGSKKLDDIRWHLLLWCVNVKKNLTMEVRKIPNEFKIAVLAIAFLYKAQEISLLHADALLATEHSLSANSNSKVDVVKPKILLGHIVRAAQKYNRAMVLIRDCFDICGLQRYIGNSNFNGFHFHNLCTEFHKAPAVYDTKMDPVKHLRIYAKSNSSKKLNS